MHHNFRSTIVMVLCLCTLMFSSVSAADGKTSAKKHFEFGLSFLEDEDYESAAKEFEASVALYPTKNGLFNLANCHLSMRRYKDAIDAMEKLNGLFKKEINRSWKQEIEEFEKKLDEKVVRLELQVNVDGATVQIDGHDVGKYPLGKSLVLELGEYEIVVSRDGYKPEKRDLSLDSGGKTKLMLELEREPDAMNQIPSAPSAMEDHELKDEKDRKTKPGLLIGSICAGSLGLVGVGVGIYFNAQYNEHLDEVDRAREQYEGTPNSITYGLYEEAFSKAKDDTLPKDKAGMAIGYVIGGVFIATGIVLFAINQVKRNRTKNESVAIVPTANGLAITF